MAERIIVLDTETTGLEKDEAAEVVEVAIREGLEDDPPSWLWRIKPIRPVPEEAIAIHGITNNMLANCPSFGEVADEIAAKIRDVDVLVGYNPDYDVRMLDREFMKSRVDLRWPKVIVCCKRLWDIHRPRPKRGLSEAYQQFVDPSGFEGAHGAAKDARATAQVLRAQLDAFDLQETAWADMDPDRRLWWGPSNHVVWREGILYCNFGKYARVAWHHLPNRMLRWILNQDFPRHVKMLSVEALKPWKGRDEVVVGRDLADWAFGY